MHWPWPCCPGAGAVPGATESDGNAADRDTACRVRCPVGDEGDEEGFPGQRTTWAETQGTTGAELTGPERRSQIRGGVGAGLRVTRRQRGARPPEAPGWHSGAPSLMEDKTLLSHRAQSAVVQLPGQPWELGQPQGSGAGVGGTEWGGGVRGEPGSTVRGQSQREPRRRELGGAGGRRKGRTRRGSMRVGSAGESQKPNRQRQHGDLEGGKGTGARSGEKLQRLKINKKTHPDSAETNYRERYEIKHREER